MKEELFEEALSSVVFNVDYICWIIHMNHSQHAHKHQTGDEELFEEAVAINDEEIFETVTENSLDTLDLQPVEAEERVWVWSPEHCSCLGWTLPAV